VAKHLRDSLTAVSVPLLILGLAFQTAQTVLVALAWRNILRAAYPKGGVKFMSVLSYYAGGNALNGILPASAGTVAMLGFFRTSIEGSTVSACGRDGRGEPVLHVVAALIYGWLFSRRRDRSM
jgi:uncharacterized membrane protein YbhN (UPF0104 family)